MRTWREAPMILKWRSSIISFNCLSLPITRKAIQMQGALPLLLKSNRILRSLKQMYQSKMKQSKMQQSMKAKRTRRRMLVQRTLCLQTRPILPLQPHKRTQKLPNLQQSPTKHRQHSTNPNSTTLLPPSQKSSQKTTLPNPNISRLSQSLSHSIAFRPMQLCFR